MTPRLYCPQPLEVRTEFALPSAAAHHAARVLRLKTGDAVTLFNGEGGEFGARLIRIDARTVVAAVESKRAIERESPLAVTLAQGLATAERMDYVVQKSVEMGVAAILPLATARSVSRLDAARADRRLEHWRQVAIASCEQCGRNRLPLIHPLRDIEAWLREPSAAALRLLMSPEADDSLAALERPSGTVELLVGPEGGLTPEEATAATRAGFRAVRLGPRILRTETAALAMLAAVNALWGDWR